MEAVNNFLVSVDNFVWGVPLMVLIMAGGIIFTIRLGLLQIRKLPLALKWMIKNEEDATGEISSFAALCTALSATIGTGNIVGVATAYLSHSTHQVPDYLMTSVQAPKPFVIIPQLL